MIKMQINKKLLCEKIGFLSPTEHEEIFKILSSKSVDYTQNRNGLFFDISKLDTVIVTEIDKFVNFCINNQAKLDEYDQHMIKCKMDNHYNKIKKHSHPLDKMITSNEVIEDWKTLLAQAKDKEKVKAFAAMLNGGTASHVVKKMSVNKFFNAKKKFAKKNVKNDGEMPSTLARENYLLDKN